jgi:alcohol dehydrogenase class IV
METAVSRGFCMGVYGLRSEMCIPELVIYGTNTVKELGTRCKKYGKKTVLIYGGHSFMKSGNYERVKGALEREGLDVEEIGGVGHDPDEIIVKTTVEKIRENSPDTIVGAGGGSVLDVAKAASIIAPNGGEVRDYWAGKTFTLPSIPYIAVPTTSGTGAEVTKNAVITSADGNSKKSIRSDYMIPNAALVDPSLTLSVPPAATIDTGLDALIQNLEAYTSKNSGPLTDTLARKGIELSGKYLLRAVENPVDLEAREALALSSLYGGITLANAGLGLAHGLSHPIGIRFGLPHGRACAVTMPLVMELNYPARRDRYDEIGALLGGSRDGAVAFRLLLEKLGVSTRLRDYGIKKEDIPVIVKDSKGGSRNFNPIDHSDETVAKMLEEML